MLALVLGLAAGCGSGGPAAEPPSEPAAGEQGAEALVALVRDWYAEADPGICDRLSDRLLERGWEAAGETGRAKCRASVGGAEPVEDVEIEPPEIAGDEARVVVAYTLDGERRADEVTFVRVDGVWLADGVALLPE